MGRTRSTGRQRTKRAGRPGRAGRVRRVETGRQSALPGPPGHADPVFLTRRNAMPIVRWDPFRDFGFTAPSTFMPPIDIFQTGDHELVLKAELPAMSRDDIDINIENFVLTIKGEKKAPTEVKD